ncbi:MAG: hypothetical protein DRQ51_05900 [Gammaproteobacteria bacterium]|nr:MAG: hypothetical protein DRQ51_05900 [Gammaproteobacteria bacterium]
MKKIIVAIVIVVLVVGGYFGFLQYQSNQAQVKFDKSLEEISQYADIYYENLSISPTMSASLDNVKITTKIPPTQTINIKNITIHNFEQKDNNVVADLIITGMEVDLGQIGEDGKILTELGYGNVLMVDAIINFDYNFKAKKLNFKKFSYSIKNLGKITVSFVLNEIIIDQKSPMSIIAIYPKIELNRAKISYADFGLADKIFSKIEKEDKLKKADIIQVIEVLPYNKEQSKEIKAELVKFINKPNNITLSVKPAKPMPVSKMLTLQSPESEKDTLKIINLFNLKIKGE